MKLFRLIFLLLIAITIVSAQKQNTNKVKMKSQEDSVSYSFGQSIFNSLKETDMNINFDILMQGLKDAAAGKSELTQVQMQGILSAFNQKMMVKKNEEMKKTADKNKKIGEDFLAANIKKEGVVILPSGVQYKILVTGKGSTSPKDTSIVRVHYKGTLIDGREFDSSYKRNEPAEFPLNRVIKGWTEGVQLMHVGDKWQFFIPSELGYGENGAGEMIPPNATLIFEIELLEIVK